MDEHSRHSPDTGTDRQRAARGDGDVPAGGDGTHPAGQRLRQSYGSVFWTGIILSTVLHFGVFYFWPSLEARDVSVHSGELKNIELPPEIDIPPPPEQIARPATPVVADAGEIDEDLTISPTTFEANPVEDLPPPPEDDGAGDLSEAPTFTPYTVKPSLKNRREVARALEEHYPPLLRDAGIGGTVLVWFFIDDQGRVQNTQIRESSGHRALDEAALEVAEVFRFSPALNRDKRVPVWIALPIRFQTS